MKKSIKFAELHAPLFHGGKNHGMKLKAGPNLVLWYDTEDKELLVEYMNAVSHIPSTSIHSYEEQVAGFAIPVDELQGGVSRQAPTKKVKAQVSGPHDHVFQGEGAGIKRDR